MSITFSVRTEKDLKEGAEKVLSDIGLNLNTVINLMMRQIVIQNGVPFDMKSSDAKKPVKVERRKMTADKSAVDFAYDLSKKVYLGEMDADTAAQQIAAATGRTASTEALTIEMLCRMLRGEVYDMRRDATTTRRFLELIRLDFGEQEFQNALSALRQHIEKISVGKKRGPVSLEVIAVEMENPIVAEFAAFLEAENKKDTTDSGHRSTIYSYIQKANQIVVRRGITWADLPDHIDAYLVEYDKGGERETEGKVSHSTALYALKAFKRFCKTR